MDLASVYRALVRKHFPQAKIVADRFHVIRRSTTTSWPAGGRLTRSAPSIAGCCRKCSAIATISSPRRRQVSQERGCPH
jgi:hypothetical protein